MKYVDMHCDTITVLHDKKGSLRSNDLHIDLEKMRKGECLLQNFAVFTDIKKHDSSYTRECIGFYHQQLEENKDLIRGVYHHADIEKNRQDGYMNPMLTLEDGGVVDNDLRNLDAYYEQGVRMITLTWNYPNGIGYPNFVYEKDSYGDILHSTNDRDGLTEFGIEYVKRMEELGIIVDVSHLSDKGFYDVLKYTSKPFVASHSSARAICSVARNLSDEMIVKLSQRGGVTGINYCSAFIHEHDDNLTKIEGIVEHIRHIVKIGGIDCVGLGSDFDGIGSTLEFKDCSGMPLLYEALKPYFNEEEIEKIFYKNVLRVYKENLR